MFASADARDGDGAGGGGQRDAKPAGRFRMSGDGAGDGKRGHGVTGWEAPVAGSIRPLAARDELQTLGENEGMSESAEAIGSHFRGGLILREAADAIEKGGAAEDSGEVARVGDVFAPAMRALDVIVDEGLVVFEEDGGGGGERQTHFDGLGGMRKGTRPDAPLLRDEVLHERSLGGEGDGDDGERQ